MATLKRYRVNWTGFSGAPGLSTFYGSSSADLLDDLRTFFNAIKAFIPLTATMQFPNAGDLIDDTTGTITGLWGEAVALNVVGTYASAYSAPSGMNVSWITSGIVAGRRVRGRTFIVPYGGYEADGSLLNSSVTTTATAAAALVTATAGSLMIWSRPQTVPAVRAGSSYPIVASTVADTPTVLRSRRD